MSCNCEHTIVDCGCSPCVDQGFSPVICDDPELCEETFSSDCILFPDRSLKCASDIFSNIDLVLVPDNPTKNDRRLTNILTKIENQFCFATNKIFLKNLLEIILDDEGLRDLYCEVVCNCDC
jgi:hypothetical protein